MNANELADALQETEPYYSTDYKLFDQAATMLRQQQAEIEALKSDGKVCARCGAIAYDPVITQTAKTLTDDAIRYRWLRKEFGAGRETYLAECIPSEEYLDKYIDEQLRKAQEK